MDLFEKNNGETDYVNEKINLWKLNNFEKDLSNYCEEFRNFFYLKIN